MFCNANYDATTPGKISKAAERQEKKESACG
jgi:hypothetical protein